MEPGTRESDTAFAEIIYADAQWLRQEFDALIAASFGQPPAAPPPAPPKVPPYRRPPAAGRWRQTQIHPPAINGPATAAPEYRRQRSPPARRTAVGSRVTAC